MATRRIELLRAQQQRWHTPLSANCTVTMPATSCCATPDTKTQRGAASSYVRASQDQNMLYESYANPDKQLRSDTVMSRTHSHASTAHLALVTRSVQPGCQAELDHRGSNDTVPRPSQAVGLVGAHQGALAHIWRWWGQARLRAVDRVVLAARAVAAAKHRRKGPAPTSPARKQNHAVNHRSDASFGHRPNRMRSLTPH